MAENNFYKKFLQSNGGVSRLGELDNDELKQVVPKERERLAPVNEPDLENEVIADLGKSFLSGVARIPGQVAELAQLGDQLVLGKGLGLREPGESNELLQAIQDYSYGVADRISGSLSEGAKQSQQKVAQAETTLGAIKEAIKNPSYIANQLAGSAPSTMLSGGAAYLARGTLLGAKGAGIATEGALNAAEASASARQEALNEMSNATPDALIGISSRYADLREGGATHDQAVRQLSMDTGAKAAAIAAGLSVFASRITGAGKLEADFFTGKGVGDGLIATLREGAEEFIQEGGSQLGQNIAARDTYDPEQGIAEGVTRTGALGALTGIAQAGTMRGVDFATSRGESRPSESPMLEGAGPLTRALNRYGIAKPKNKVLEAEREAAGINPVTGDPLQTKAVADLNLQYQRSLARLAAAETEREVEFFTEAAADAKTKLREIGNRTEDPIASREAREVIGGKVEDVPAPQPEASEQAPQETPQRDQQQPRGDERLRKLAERYNLNLPEAESTGGIFRSTGSAEADDLVAARVFTELTSDGPLTAAEEEAFKQSFPNWWKKNFDEAVNVRDTKGSQPEPETAREADKQILESIQKEAEALAQEELSRRGEFTPTHILPDGTAVRKSEDEDNVYVDSEGSEIEDDNALTLSEYAELRQTQEQAAEAIADEALQEGIQQVSDQVEQVADEVAQEKEEQITPTEPTVDLENVVQQEDLQDLPEDVDPESVTVGQPTVDEEISGTYINEETQAPEETPEPATPVEPEAVQQEEEVPSVQVDTLADDASRPVEPIPEETPVLEEPSKDITSQSPSDVDGESIAQVRDFLIQQAQTEYGLSAAQAEIALEGPLNNLQSYKTVRTFMTAAKRKFKSRQADLETIYDERSKEQKVADLRRKEEAGTITAADRKSTEYVFEVATSPAKLAVKDKVNFHRFNPNGIVAEHQALVDQLSERVEKGELAEGHMLSVMSDDDIINETFTELSNKTRPTLNDIARAVSQVERLNARLREALQKPANTKPDFVGSIPKEGMVPAVRGTDGKIYVGKKGQLHINISIENEAAPHQWEAGGFVDSDGNFLSRTEAAEALSREGELDAADILPSKDNISGAQEEIPSAAGRLTKPTDKPKITAKEIKPEAPAEDLSDKDILELSDDIVKNGFTTEAINTITSQFGSVKEFEARVVEINQNKQQVREQAKQEKAERRKAIAENSRQPAEPKVLVQEPTNQTDVSANKVVASLEAQLNDAKSRITRLDQQIEDIIGTDPERAERLERQLDAAYREAQRLEKKIKGSKVSGEHASDEDIKDLMANRDSLDHYDPDLANELPFMYVGVSAKTLTGSVKAFFMEKSGFSADTIKKKTGWFRGPDEKWRFDLTVNPGNTRFKSLPQKSFSNFNEFYKAALANAKPEYSGLAENVPSYLDLPLTQVLDSDILYETYPMLRQYRVVLDTSGSSGFFNPKEKVIGVDPSLDIVNAYETMIHELQHAIQSIEGFAAGSDPSRSPSYKLYKNISREMDAIESEVLGDTFSSFVTIYQAEVKSGRLSIAQADIILGQLANRVVLQQPDYMVLSEKRDEYYAQAYAEYQNQLGEIEARDAAMRALYTGEDLRDIPPYQLDMSARGISDEDIIISFSNRAAKAIPDYARPSRKQVNTLYVREDGSYYYKHNYKTAEEFKDVAGRYNAGIKRLVPEYRVRAVNDIEDLPVHIQRDISRRFGSANVRGVFDSKTKSIYVVINNHATKKDLEITLLHEVVGHFGMKNMFEVANGGESSAYTAALEKEAKKNKALLQTAASNIYGRGYRSLFRDSRQDASDLQVVIKGKNKYLSVRDAGTVLDEHIAFSTAEMMTNPEFEKKYGGFRKRIIAAIKHAFRKIGFDFNMTQDDIYSLISESNKRIFDLENDTAVGFLQGNAKFRQRLARLTDPESADFIPEAAARYGIAPTGSYARESEAIRYMAEDKTPEQQEFEETQASIEDKMLADVLAKMHDGYGDTMANGWEKFVDDTWSKVMRNPFMQKMAKLGPLGRVSQKDMYRALNAEARGSIAAAESKAKTLAKLMKKFNKDQSTAVMEYFTTANADVNAIPDLNVLQRKQIERAKETIADLGQQLVELGVLDPDVYASRKGEYLPAVYYKYLEGFGASGKRISFGGYLRQRKDLSRIEKVELGKIEDPSIVVPNTIGTIARDIALMRLTNNIVKFSGERDLGWVLGENYKVKYITASGKARLVNLYQLNDDLDRMQEQKREGIGGAVFDLTPEKMAELDSRIRYVERLIGVAEQQREVEISNMLSAQGVDPRDITPQLIEQYLKENYRQIPADRSYGALSNKYVMKSIFNDFVDTVQAMDETMDQSIATGKRREGGLGSVVSWAETGHQYWKAGKVAYNVPVSTIRNGFGNLVLLDTSTNTNIGKLIKMFAQELKGLVEEAYDPENNKVSRFWEYGRQFGVFGTTFSANELNRLRRTAKADLDYLTSINESKGMISLMSKKTRRSFSNLLNILTDFYGGQEGIFKVVKMRDYIETWEKENNVSIEDLPYAEKKAVIFRAGIEANHAIFDYSEVAGWVRWARRTPFLGSPFLTFTYKSLFKMPENMVKHPQKFAKYLAITSAAVQSALAGLSDDWEDEEFEDVRKTLADYYQTSGNVFVYPHKDDNGNPMITDLTPMLPWGAHLNLLKGIKSSMSHPDAIRGAFGVGNELLEWSGFLSTPVLGTAARIQLGIDPFTGREITTPGMSGRDAMEAWARNLWTLAAPPILTEQGALGHVLDNYGVSVPMISTGRQLNRLGEDRETGWQAASRFTGFNTVPQPQALNKSNTVINRDYQLRELDTERRRILRDPNLKRNPQERARKLRQIAETRKHVLKKFEERLN